MMITRQTLDASSYGLIIVAQKTIGLIKLFFLSHQ